MSVHRPTDGSRPVAEETWELASGPVRELTGSAVHDPELLRRIAAFERSDLESVSFLWYGNGRWARCRIRRGPTVTVALLLLDGPPAGLTAREVDVVSLVALGLSNREISSRLGTSVRTVTTQVERLLRKTGQESRAGLGAMAVDRELVRLPLPGGVDRGSGIRVLDLERLAADEPSRPSGLRRVSGGRRPLRVGTIALGGAFAVDGEETIRGASLAVRDVNAPAWEGGRPVEHVMVAIDPLSEVSVRAGLAMLVEQDVDAITSSYASAFSPAVFDFAADYGRIFLHTNSWTHSVDAVRSAPARYRHVFQSCPSENAYQAALIAHLRAHTAGRCGRGRLAVIELDGYGCSITGAGFSARVSEVGWAVTAVARVGLSVRDADAVAAEALGDGADLVVVSHVSPKTAAQVQNALTRARPGQESYHIYTPSLPGFARYLEPGGGGLTWSTVTGRSDDALGQRFAEAYTRQFGVPPGWTQASAAYDQVRMLHTAVSVTGSLRPAVIGEYLRSEAYRGVNGTYLFASPGQFAAGFPYDSTDLGLAQPTLTYRMSGSRQESVPLSA
ncbi:ABC transporter substrate-binding protein [Streptomyces sp. NPDC001508]|uniref:ABC transporter substrate-binding protein n=1 Tax=Streptomyces sp. NPDC001508 TaxID=3154656 RepID=UPI00331BC906